VSGERERRAQQTRPQARPRDVRVRANFLEDLTKMFKGDPSEACRKKYEPQLARINSLEQYMQGLSDEQLRAKTNELRERVQRNVKGLNVSSVTNEVFTEDVVCESFALVREGSRRAIGLRPFDCQMIGGLVLHNGEIAEMGTGEGKTLVSVAPAFLNALTGLGVHVVTVNDYLARRDAEWVGRVHTFLGLRVGLVQSQGAGMIGGQISEAKEGSASVDPEVKREAYRADITYVTNSELGFDFLRDNLAATKEELVLRDNNPYYCIIDEVDSILIDEARTPLIISGQAEQPSSKYERACKIAMALVKEEHYTVEEKRQTTLLTEEGYEAVESVLQVTDLYDPREQWISFISNAIKAKELQKKDVNYIVKEREVIIVDEFTGRTMPGRRWGEGLHQAIEAKEGLKIQNETVTLASISYQNFFRAYQKKSGMTGTAATEAAEFESIYNLQTSVVPTNKPSQRTDNADVVFRSESGKWNAVLIEIRRMYKTGRPILVGTTSVEESEALAAKLDEEGIPYQLLNAKPENVQRESEIVAQSGRLGAVTISTNMAGRGTDILLGGNADFMARLKVREALFPQIVAADAEPEDKSIVKGKRKKKAQQTKEWILAEDLYPCVLSKEAQDLLQETAASVSAELGGKISELEASDKLARACEMASTRDSVSGLIHEAYSKVCEEYKSVTQEEKNRVIQLGGLHVIGTERHESRRIDNQLRGRSGRQGDKGSTRFFLSLEDKIFRMFGGDRVKAMMSAFRVEDLPIESQMLTSALNEAQRKVEAYFYDIRKQLFEYDEVLNIQREKVYSERRRALLATDLSKQMVEYAELTVNDVLEANIDPASAEETWNLDGLAGKMKQYCYLLEDLDGDVLRAQDGYEGIRYYLQNKCVEAYQQKVSEVNAVEDNLMAEAEQFFVLTQYDNLWKTHLQSIKFLQTAVGLRGYAQRDPLTEFKLEGYNLFLEMMAQVRRNCIYSVYQFKPETVVKQDQQQTQAQETTVNQSQ
jgi:preprotein translocase subunit SecA